MDLPKNRFKAALAAGEHQLGIWNAIGRDVVPEMLAVAGFDWVVLDSEHSPIDVTDTLPAMQALAAYPEVSAVVRPAWNDVVLIKRFLDMGAQTLLIPYIQSREEAEAAVNAMRYPPRGMRGVAGATRASRWAAVKDYHLRAEEELCLIVQVETGEALENLDEIATVDGVHGVFIGPSDLAASLGHAGEPNHPEVVAAIEGAFARLKELGVPSGILTLNETFARRCIELGTSFTAVGVDSVLLNSAVQALRGRFA